MDIEYEPISLYNSAMFQGGATEQMRRVLSLEQLHAASSDYTAAITQRGAKLKIDYQHMCTEVTAVEDASSDAGKKLTYQFNDGGNVVCVRDELGYARFTKCDSAIENTPCNVQGNIAGPVDSGNSIVIEYKHDQRVIYGPIGHALRRRVNIQEAH